LAEDKKKEGAAKAEDGAKKKGLPAIVMVAVGAIVGGAGVVFAVPPKTVEVPVAEPVYHDIDVTHPDPIKKEFNPRTRAGKGIGRVAMKFVYTVREDQEAAAFEQIKAHWEFANSNVLMILKTRSMEELQSEAGVRMLERDLMDDLDRTLFPVDASGHKLASVTKLVWVDWLMQ
jgi:flagellar basal body-associated protein FliL